MLPSLESLLVNSPIETRRYINTERQNRMCTLCERGIGDELHYLSKCNYALLKVCREKCTGHIRTKGERFSQKRKENQDGP